MAAVGGVWYLTQKQAAEIDEALMGPLGFSVDQLMVSLTAPKLCAKTFSGPHHFLGGRFVPPSVAEKFNLELPAYPGTSMSVRITTTPKIETLATKENDISPEILEDQLEADPFDQFQRWFDDAGIKEPKALSLSTVGGDKNLHREWFCWRALTKKDLCG